MNNVSLKEASWNRLGIASNSVAAGWSITKKIVPNIQASGFWTPNSFLCFFFWSIRLAYVFTRPTIFKMFMLLFFPCMMGTFDNLKCPSHRTPGCTVAKRLSRCVVVLGLQNRLGQSCKRLSWSTPRPTVNWRWTSEQWHCGIPVCYLSVNCF